MATPTSKAPSTGYLVLVAGLTMVAGGIAFPSVQNPKSPVVDGLPVIPTWLEAVLQFGGAIVVMAGIATIYDRRPLPQEPITPVKDPQLKQDEPWRDPSDLRFLETLKLELGPHEEVIEEAYKEAKAAYDKLPNSSGRLEYAQLKLQKANAEDALAEALEAASKLKVRIDRLWQGNVDHELLTLKEQSSKLKRTKAEHERTLKEWEAPCGINHANNQERAACDAQRADQRQRELTTLHSIDEQLIEVDTHIEELKTHDFRKLRAQMGSNVIAERGLASVDPEQLKGLKEKADVFRSIPSLEPDIVSDTTQNGPRLSADERRAKDKQDSESRIQNLKAEKQKALKLDDETERILKVNAIDDALQREMERWAKLL